ncbi:MAG: triose-phosphate isomerase [Bacillota bacterium]
MRSRRPLVAANWKMYKTRAQARAFVEEFLPQFESEGVDVVICPPFTAIDAVAAMVVGRPMAVGGQDVHWEEEGAFTGEVSPGMLVEAGCRYVIVGHSERRHLFGETDGQVGRKLRAALGHGLVPILCVGETLAQREAGATEEVVARQLVGALRAQGFHPAQGMELVVAYEPVWAIGTGHNARPEDAAGVAGFIRARLEEYLGRDRAVRVRILYGGSVKPGNIAGFADRPELDGALVGGASLDATSLAQIVTAFAHPGGR